MNTSNNFYRNNNQFIKLIIANAISRFGDSIDMNKKHVMVCSDFLRAIAIFILVISYRIGVADHFVLLCFTAIVSFIETFRIPAGVSIIPSLLNEVDYKKGISTNNSISKIFELVGLVSSAFLISKLGSDGVI